MNVKDKILYNFQEDIKNYFGHSKGQRNKETIASIICYKKLTTECLEYKFVMSFNQSIPIKRTFSAFPSTLDNYLKAQHQMQESYASQAKISINEIYTKNIT